MKIKLSFIFLGQIFPQTNKIILNCGKQKTDLKGLVSSSIILYINEKSLICLNFSLQSFLVFPHFACQATQKKPTTITLLLGFKKADYKSTVMRKILVIRQCKMEYPLIDGPWIFNHFDIVWNFYIQTLRRNIKWNVVRILIDVVLIIFHYSYVISIRLP